MIEALYDEWANFLRQYYKTQMDEILLTYPLKKSLYVDYWDVDRYSESLAESLLFSPKESFAEAQKALDTFVEGKDVALRIKNLTKTYRLKISGLRSENLNKFIAIEGLVKKVTEVRPILKVGVYKCSNCGEETYVAQDTKRLQEPAVCQSCGKRAIEIRIGMNGIRKKALCGISTFTLSTALPPVSENFFSTSFANKKGAINSSASRKKRRIIAG